jgi:excisionase family DNA binding protein
MDRNHQHSQITSRFTRCGAGLIIDVWLNRNIWRKKKNSELPQLLIISEVASYLRMSKSQGYTLLAKKRLPCIRLSKRRVVVSQQDLIAYISRQREMETSQL